MLLVLGVVAVLALLFAVGARGEDTVPVNEIEQAVLAAEARAGYTDVRVEIDGLTATLIGTLDTEADVLAAGAVARSVEEVVLVTNNLRSREVTAPTDLEPTEVQVNSTSAELEFQAELSTLAAVNPIRFESSVDDLVEGSGLILDGIAEKLSENASATIEIQGHTDSDGEEAANQDLSERRANRVKAELEARGIPADQLRAVGYGESLPVSDNETQEGKARNRRIEFRIVPAG